MHEGSRRGRDADLIRIVLDPDSGMPLDVGRSHRLIPHWIRKALITRDRGCRWPGCHTHTNGPTATTSTTGATAATPASTA
jgi:hypothetical protein